VCACVPVACAHTLTVRCARSACTRMQAGMASADPLLHTMHQGLAAGGAGAEEVPACAAAGIEGEQGEAEEDSSAAADGSSSSEAEEGSSSTCDSEEGTEEAEAIADKLLAAAAGSSSACQVCHEQPSKYCCPGCSCRTCSLPCSKQHKASTGCTGQRDRLAYVPLQAFSDKHLISGGGAGAGPGWCATC